MLRDCSCLLILILQHLITVASILKRVKSEIVVMSDPNFSLSLQNIDAISDNSCQEPDRIDKFNFVKNFVYVPDKSQSVAYRAKIKKTGITKSLIHYMGWNKRHDEWVCNDILLKVPDNEMNNDNVNAKNVINLNQQEFRKLYKTQVNNEVSKNCKEKSNYELDISLNEKEESVTVSTDAVVNPETCRCDEGVQKDERTMKEETSKSEKEESVTISTDAAENQKVDSPTDEVYYVYDNDIMIGKSQMMSTFYMVLYILLFSTRKATVMTGEICHGHSVGENEVKILVSSVVEEIEVPNEFCVGAILKWKKANLRLCSSKLKGFFFGNSYDPDCFENIP